MSDSQKQQMDYTERKLKNLLKIVACEQYKRTNEEIGRTKKVFGQKSVWC